MQVDYNSTSIQPNNIYQWKTNEHYNLKNEMNYKDVN